MTTEDTPTPLESAIGPVYCHSVQEYLDAIPKWDDGTPVENPPKTSMQKLIFILASTGKLFEGLVVFMTGMALPLIVHDLQLSATESGIVTATTLGGILIGALLLGNLSDRFGRKAMFIVEMVIFTGFLIGMCFAPNLPILLICQLGMGIALGCDYPTAHLMLSETMSSTDRGRSVLGAFAFQAIGAVVGAVVAVAVLALLPPNDDHWRVMFGLAVMPAVAVTIGRFFVVQSPHWLIAVGRHREAEVALAKLLKRNPQFPSAINLSGYDGENGKRGRYRDLFRKGKDGCRRATILASVPWFIQDLSTYGIGIFTPVVLATVLGTGTTSSMTGSERVVQEALNGAQGAVIIDSFLVVGILIAIRFVNRLGSIRMQIWGFIGCAIGMGVAALGNGIAPGTAQTVLIFVGFMIFTFTTNAGPNAQTYLIAGEVFPTELRGSGSGFAAASGKVGAVLTSFLFPVLLVRFGATPILIGLIVCSLIGAYVTNAYRIDTTGKNLETIHGDTGTFDVGRTDEIAA